MNGDVKFGVDGRLLGPPAPRDCSERSKLTTMLGRFLQQEHERSYALKISNIITVQSKGFELMKMTRNVFTR